jgi:hypothetical protein
MLRFVRRTRRAENDEAPMKPTRYLLLAFALVPLAIALLMALADSSPFAAASISSLAVAGRSAWLWLAALTAGALTRRPLHALAAGLVVAGASILLWPARDAAGLTGSVLLNAARFDIAVIAALLGQGLRAIWHASRQSAFR